MMILGFSSIHSPKATSELNGVEYQYPVKDQKREMPEREMPEREPPKREDNLVYTILPPPLQDKE
jgi:hypothetical protein